MTARMEGYDVIGSDEGKLGHVVEVDGDFVIVEEGHLRKKRYAIPTAFAHPDDGEQVVRLTVSKELVEDSPTFKDGELDRQAAAAHYGLAEGYDAPETKGYGELTPDDPAWSAEQEGLRTGVEPAAAAARGEPRGPGARRPRPADHPAGPARPALDRFELPEAGPGHRGQDRLAVGLLVVPLELHLAHQVRVRELEALVPAQRAGEAADAALAADAADLDRLGASGHLARS